MATPDHWHGPASILACQAGKDVYVEKPHAHNIWESGKMIEAAASHERILQVGTQAPQPMQVAASKAASASALGTRMALASIAGANHSHTVWHDLRSGFGADLLRAHYEAAHRKR